MAKKKKKKLRTREQKPSRQKKPCHSGPAVIGSRSVPRDSAAAMLMDGEALLPAKMSEILLEVAQPALEHISDDADLDQYRRALLLAAMAWNASRYDDPDQREKEIHAFVESTSFEDARDRQDLREILTFLTNRAALLWPDLKAFAAGVEVNVSETGELRVSVEFTATVEAKLAPGIQVEVNQILEDLGMETQLSIGEK